MNLNFVFLFSDTSVVVNYISLPFLVCSLQTSTCCWNRSPPPPGDKTAGVEFLKFTSRWEFLLRMDLDLRLSFQGEPSRNDPGSENLALKASQGYVIRDGEGISEFPNTRLSLFQNSSNSFARRELQRLYNLFHSWLQPEKRSKDEMISCLVLEQFVINGHCSDRSTLQEKWNASGRNLEKFMEDLTDDGMKQPGFVSRGVWPPGEERGGMRNE